MKKIVAVFIGIMLAVSLLSCQKSNANQQEDIGHGAAGKTTIEMELDENYDASDPFVNARLFRVNEDMDVLDAEISVQLDGESGFVEIKDNGTDETLWSNTWHERIDEDTAIISLANMQKAKEYSIWFTGTKINHAVIKVTFESELVQELESSKLP